MKQAINKFIYNRPVLNAIIRELTGYAVVKINEVSKAEILDISLMPDNSLEMGYFTKDFVIKYEWHKDKRNANR